MPTLLTSVTLQSKFVPARSSASVRRVFLKNTLAANPIPCCCVLNKCFPELFPNSSGLGEKIKRHRIVEFTGEEKQEINHHHHPPLPLKSPDCSSGLPVIGDRSFGAGGLSLAKVIFVFILVGGGDSLHLSGRSQPVSVRLYTADGLEIDAEEDRCEDAGHR